jgi:hypothetical protein
VRVLAGCALVLLASATTVDAQVRVNPTGVSVNSMDATTVFLTFGGLHGQRPTDAYWCGELVSAAPARGLKCDPSTLFGRLPFRYDVSSLGTGAFTDIMSIPASVARLAYQAAQRGATSTFFYVRRFESALGEPDEYVAVTCRLTGGGARVPFSLTDVHLEYATRDAVPFIAVHETPPQISARITYNGTGRLVGRWEIVMPGEELPAPRDLLTEASLPLEERGSQRRFIEIDRFNIFLAPDGRVSLPGPDVRRLPTAVEGTYRVLLRIEATDDREGDSNLADAGAGTGIVHSGAVAGFPMPVLQYVVAGDGARTPTDVALGIRLFGPRNGDTLRVGRALTMTWAPDLRTRANFYRLDIETDEGATLLSALLPQAARRYEAPDWVIDRANGKAIRWRVTALGADGRPIQSSVWRLLRNPATLPATHVSADSRRNPA